MAFGIRPITSFLTRSPWGIAAIALSLLAAGCGGGGGGGSTPGGGGGGTGNGTITGTIVDGTSGATIANATITYAGQTTKSNTLGTFSLSAPAQTSAQPLRVVGPNKADGTPAYFNAGQYQGRTISLGTDGIQIASLSENQTLNLGVIKLFSQDGPPPPPSF